MMTIVFAPVLGLSALLCALFAARTGKSARDYLRFAAALYLALSLCIEGAVFLAQGPAFVAAMTLFVGALAPVSLALALFADFEHCPPSIVAAVLLIIALFAGIAAAASGLAVLSFATMMAASFVMLALCVRQARRDARAGLYGALSVISLVLGAAAMHGDGAGEVALALFTSAALLGFGLALARCSELAVAQARNLRRAAAIGGKG